jgi:hypothetical protein
VRAVKLFGDSNKNGDWFIGDGYARSNFGKQQLAV